MKISGAGCTHGELETVYDEKASIEERVQVKVDLLLCCGDFEAARNLNSLLITSSNEC